MLLLFFYVLGVLFFGCEKCGILVSWAGTELAPPALEGEVPTTGPPHKSCAGCLKSTGTSQELEAEGDGGGVIMEWKSNMKGELGEVYWVGYGQCQLLHFSTLSLGWIFLPSQLQIWPFLLLNCPSRIIILILSGLFCASLNRCWWSSLWNPSALNHLETFELKATCGTNYVQCSFLSLMLTMFACCFN